MPMASSTATSCKVTWTARERWSRSPLYKGGNDFLLTIHVPSELTRYIVAKGSLSIEGISLTVAAIDGIEVRVAIIPHTAEVTNLGSLKVGDPINLEVDVIAKYVEKMISPERAATPITLEKLVRAGF